MALPSYCSILIWWVKNNLGSECLYLIMKIDGLLWKITAAVVIDVSASVIIESVIHIALCPLAIYFLY